MSIMEDTAYATKPFLPYRSSLSRSFLTPSLSDPWLTLSSLLALITIYTGYVYCQLTLLEPGSDAFHIANTTSPFGRSGGSDDGSQLHTSRDLGDNAFETLIVSAAGFVELKSQEPSGSTVTGTVSLG
ncbi:hypothetical protein BT96DRAFT_305602 [Gymnopus androsaceus JB14]|uniref:Uncharacterized protein n=1 Tax=Gymnopus androsaceus JB14 TaxID=1447944 RepID=A0A6A4I5I0_9AGAR|nr:hypothetical protein BT96DRAFT_305602 [Gymnopus androsaceus JB14]